jgi:hypothetical protein
MLVNISNDNPNQLLIHSLHFLMPALTICLRVAEWAVVEALRRVRDPAPLLDYQAQPHFFVTPGYVNAPAGEVRH